MIGQLLNKLTKQKSERLKRIENAADVLQILFAHSV